MLSLLFGVGAALLWGVHDVCVRFVTAKCGPATAFLAVLSVGALLILPFAVAMGGWSAIGTGNATLGILSGLTYAAAGYSLYRAFEIGPVRLVAPLIGAYPVLSVLWAAVQGRPPDAAQALAVLAIVAGVGLNAVLSDEGDAASDGPSRLRGALLWSLAACAGFALTFALGQAASAQGGGVALVLLSRLAALAGLLSVTLAVDRRSISLRGAPLRLLALMGLCDATALGLVQTAGTLPNPEFAAVASSTFGMVTILLAWGLLRERMTMPQWLAVALVFAGIGYLAL